MTATDSRGMGRWMFGSIALAVILWLVAAPLLHTTAFADGERGTGAARGGGQRPIPAPGGAGGDVLKERLKRLKELNRRQPVGAPIPPPAAAPRRSQPAPSVNGRSLVTLHHGSVHLVAGLARVDLTLEVQNVGGQPMEWTRTYAMDPAAEVIGAVLKRANENPTIARTLTLPDARRIYAEVRTPPPSRPSVPPGRRDPLRVERTQRDRLQIAIWPIAAGETIRAELTFVTPLRGQGARRTYMDVMGGPGTDDSPTTLNRPSRENPQPSRPDVFVAEQAEWLVNPGEFVLASAAPTGMTLQGEAGGLLHFTGQAATESETARPTVPFLKRTLDREALLVPGGGFGAYLATWRFNPQAFLRARGFELREDLIVRLVARKGSTQRIAPHVFGAKDEARPVTARVKRGIDEVRYGIEIVDQEGMVIESYEQTLPTRTEKLDPILVGAVTGWHRAALVRRVFSWAGPDASLRQRALTFAVDMGVLVPGTAALAVPPTERRRLSRGSRQLYDNDGVPLGAQHREADFKSVPKGALGR